MDNNRAKKKMNQRFFLMTALVLLTGIAMMFAGCTKEENPSDPGTGGEDFERVTINVNGVSFNMIPVEGGTFWMGAQNANYNGQNYDSNANNDENPVHQVTLNKYYIGETEVTQALWLEVMGSWPETAPSSEFGLGDHFPAYFINWTDCQNFISELNALTGCAFRMPSEAEWEYAARGGKQSSGYAYSGSNTIDEVAWYSENSSSSHVVKSKVANELGIFDMSGNVWEWCSDWYQSDYYSTCPSDHPTGPSAGTLRVERGGSWGRYATSSRVAYRYCNAPNYRSSSIGLRLVLVQ